MLPIIGEAGCQLLLPKRKELVPEVNPVRCEICAKKIGAEKIFAFKIYECTPKEASLIGVRLQRSDEALEFALCEPCFKKFKEWLERELEVPAGVREKHDGF